MPIPNYKAKTIMDSWVWGRQPGNRDYFYNLVYGFKLNVWLQIQRIPFNTYIWKYIGLYWFSFMEKDSQ